MNTSRDSNPSAKASRSDEFTVGPPSTPTNTTTGILSALILSARRLPSKFADSSLRTLKSFDGGARLRKSRLVQQKQRSRDSNQGATARRGGRSFYPLDHIPTPISNTLESSTHNALRIRSKDGASISKHRPRPPPAVKTASSASRRVASARSAYIHTKVYPPRTTSFASRAVACCLYDTTTQQQPSNTKVKTLPI